MEDYIIPPGVIHDLLEERFGPGSVTEVFLVTGVNNQKTWSVCCFLCVGQAIECQEKLSRWVKDNNCQAPVEGLGIHPGPGSDWNPSWLVGAPISSGYVARAPVSMLNSGALAPRPDPRQSLVCPLDPGFSWRWGGVSYKVVKSTLTL